MHYLITGHTGFKGSWLAQLLVAQGHQVSGVALQPGQHDLFSTANLSEIFVNDFRQDVRDFEALEKILNTINPDVLIHFAAQPLVLESYRDPVGTYETNVNGTLNVLRASDQMESLKARLIITTDKVYRNSGKTTGYIESDSLGGVDPYSASKAMADILTQSWSTTSTGSPIAIARAGNVIGGGDFSKDRIFTDAVQSFVKDVKLELRSPSSVRPWQHVLDCLSGYLSIVDSLLMKPTGATWNIGPSSSSYKNVREIMHLAELSWGKKLDILEVESQYVETSHLTLDSSQANKLLSWKSTWNLETTVDRTIQWYKKNSLGVSPRVLCDEDISEFLTKTKSDV